MSYAHVLGAYIKTSGKTLDQIARECAARQVTVHPTYISKLRLGHRPAPSDEITRTLAEVTGGDAERLLAEASAERLSGDRKASYEKAVKDRMAIDYTLERIGGGDRIYPFLEERLRRLLEEADGLPLSPPDREMLTNRRRLAERLADPALDREAVSRLLERIDGLANAPDVLFQKWKLSAMESGADPADFLTGADGGMETYPVGQHVKVPIIGTVTAGPGGTAYEDYEGDEWADEKDLKGGGYFYLRVKGDSMTGDGILPNDLALVRETPEVEYGDIAVVVVDGEEGTLKRVYRMDDSIMLHSSNPAYAPRVFKGSDMAKVRIVGKVKQTIRRY